MATPKLTPAESQLKPILGPQVPKGGLPGEPTARVSSIFDIDAIFQNQFDPIEESLMARVLGGNRRRVNDPVIPGLSAEPTSVTADDVFGYFRDADGVIQATTWGEILTLMGVDVSLRDLTDAEVDKLRNDLYAQFPNAGFAGSPNKVAERDGLGLTLPKDGGGRGRSGGAAPIGPTYIAQDASSLREQVRNYVIASTGTGNIALIDAGIEAYSVADKERFTQRETTTIDPWQTMKEKIRSSTAYKAVHQLRPDSVDEMDWVTKRQTKLRQLGISDVRAEEAGIEAAIAGASNEALEDQANIIQLEGTGRLLEAQRQSLKQSANAVLGLV